MTDEPEALKPSEQPDPQEASTPTPADQASGDTEAATSPGAEDASVTGDAEPAALDTPTAAPTNSTSETAPAESPAPAAPPASDDGSATPTDSPVAPAAESSETPAAPSPEAAPAVEEPTAATSAPVPPAAEVAPETPPAAAPAAAPTQETIAAPQPTEPPAAAIDAAKQIDAVQSAPEGERPASRLREKLGAQSADKPVGSEDIRNQRPDVPTNIEPVEIPNTDELDAALEAEISSALGEETVTPATTAPATAEADQSAEGTPAPPAAEPEEIGPGSTIQGTIQQVHGDDVFVNAGLRSEVIVSLKQFPEGKPPAAGDAVTVVIDSVDNDGLFRARLPQAKTKTGGNWDGLAAGQVVDCTVTGTNKGGLQISLSNLKGFLPASQVDLGYVSDLEKYVGQKLTVQITEVKPKKRNLVVSRRAILAAERESQQAGFWESLEVGNDLTGTVKTMKNYGAFINLGPIDGFLHIGEISWSRINHPNEVLKEGQEIQVRVLKIDKDKNRISLGMKQLIQNPWTGLSDRYPSERVVSGMVTRVADFGAFVELEPGVEGLVHISQLAWRRVGSVNEVLKVGDEKEFQVLEVDQKRKRVSLSLKALEQKPESVRKEEAEEEARPVRKPNPDLRGGMGQNSGDGGLFGNPSDFT